MPTEGSVDGNITSEMRRNKALLNPETYNYHSPGPVIAVCIASSLIYTSLFALLGLFDIGRLHYLLGPPFVCCLVSASLAEKMRIKSLASAIMFLMVVGLCILAAGFAGSGYTVVVKKNWTEKTVIMQPHCHVPLV